MSNENINELIEVSPQNKVFYDGECIVCKLSIDLI